jgi:peptidoglycan hydrolase-like protein with peptidoglycan-binding domain
MAGITFVKVIDAGPRYTTVLADDGKTYTLKGDRNWRNNNPGNIEYGDFAKSKGAIGSDGRFAVFPSIDQGFSAQESLQFEGKSYRDKSIADAISRYAPAFENDTAAYAAEVAAAAGVPVTTKMSDLTPEQRKAFLAAQHRVEGMKPGTIMGADGVPVSPEVARQFGAVRLPPSNIPGGSSSKGSDVRAYQQQLAQRGFDPGPIDGDKGPRTTAAIKAFQKANGLDPDGIVGPKTMAALQGQSRPQTQQQPPGWARQPANTLAPPPLIQGSDIKDAFFDPLPAPKPLVAQSRMPTDAFGNPVVSAGEQAPTPRTLGATAPGNTLGMMPAQAGGSGLQETRFGPRLAAAAPPLAPAAVDAPAAPGGGFNIGGFLGGLGNTLGQTAQNIGTTLGTTAANVVEGTKTALGNTADATKDLLANDLMGTVGGRTLLFNTMLGITPAKTADDRKFERNAAAPEGYGYGASGKKLYKIGQTYNSSRGQVVFDGSKFVLSPTQVRSSVDIPSSGRAPAATINTPRPSGRTASSAGETFDSVWAEAKGY